MKLTVEERVANGARWLDENFPGWEKRINIKTLDLENGQSCICGQVFKRKAANWSKKEHIDYRDGDGYVYAYSTLFSEANSWISTLVPKGSRPVERAQRVAYVLGFTTNGFGRPTWDKLQKAWVNLLTKRAEALV
jgi:hypothetical protein